MSALITLSTSDAAVDLSPTVGGAIAAFRHRDADVLRPTPPEAHAPGNVRQFACYPLVPYSNRIAHARLSAGGADFVLDRNFGDHPHAIHGVGWQREWKVVSRDATSALLALDHPANGGGARAWPFAFRATQAFVLSGDEGHAMLSLTLTIENRDDRPFPFGLGWHPFFPCDGGTELGFAADAIWHTDDTRLPERNERLGAAQRFDPPRALRDTTLDNVFSGWRGRADLRWPAQRRHVRIEADASLAFLVVFVPERRDYLAVEPVTHMTDAFNRAARGEPDTGTLVLAPGHRRSCTMRIVSQPLP
jgi:aldose 1-epimerase